MLLEKAALARTNNFDLLGSDGVEMLRNELIKDFPYLSLVDVNDVVMRGIKGQLDKFRTRPLNFTRVYQWFEQRSVFTVGYWQAKHPALMYWPAMLSLTDAVMAEIDTYETPAQAFALPHKFRALLQKVVRKQLYPNVGNDWNPLANAEAFPAQAVAYRRVESELHSEFLARFPDQADQYTPIF